MGEPLGVPTASAYLADESFPGGASAPRAEISSKPLCGDCGATLDCWSSCPNLAALDVFSRKIAAPDKPLFCGNQSSVPCCIRVDVPGVGLSHALDCPQSGRVANLPAREAVPGEVPESLGRLLRDEPPADIAWRPSDIVDPEQGSGLGSGPGQEVLHIALLCELLFAARDVAEANIANIDGVLVCRECCMVEHLGKLIHLESCRTGRVLGVIAQLLDFPVLQLIQKEVASAGETGHAGDGIRPRGLSQRVCLKCGERGGEWTAEQWPGTTASLSLLGLNQCVGAASDGIGHTLYTHVCGERKLRGVDVLFADGAKTAEPAVWIIRRSTQKWVGTELQYEDFPTPEGLMTRTQMVEVLERVERENPDQEFCGHNTSKQPGGAK